MSNDSQTPLSFRKHFKNFLDVRNYALNIFKSLKTSSCSPFFTQHE